MIIRTEPCSASCGRTYILRIRDPQVFEEWLPILQRRAREESCRHERELAVSGMSSLQKHIYLSRAAIRRHLGSTGYQKFAALIILISFLCDIMEAQVLPAPGSLGDNVLGILDYLFTAYFVIELILNVASHHPTWILEVGNLMDAFVIFVTAASVYLAAGIPQLKILRIIKVFRVVRIFRVRLFCGTWSRALW